MRSWNIKLNWIIEAVINKMAASRSEFCEKKLSDPNNKFHVARSIEAGFFMLGYDLKPFMPLLNE